MAIRSVQLPFGVFFEEGPENKLQFNFLANFREDILFDKLSYITDSKSPALTIIIKDGVVDDLESQKYL